MRVIIGDQSVVITKVFILVFEEADLRVHVVASSSESLATRCGLGKLVCLQCVVLAVTREGLVSSRSSSVNSL